MMNTHILLVCFNAVLPTFLMMAVGFAARQFKMLDDKDVIKMNNIAFKIFMPAMLFYNIYSSDISVAVNVRLLGFAAVFVLAAFALSTAYTLLFVKDKGKQSVYIQGMYRSNFVVIGLPVASALVEGADMSAVSMLMVVVVPIFNTLAVICLETFNGRKIEPFRIFVDVVKNPLILASLAGTALLLLDIELPMPLDKAVSSLGKAASPLVLFLLGAFFRFDSLRHYARDLVQICTMRLVVIPALALSAAIVMGFRGVELAGLLGVFGSSTAVASFTMAQSMGGDAELAGNIVIATSVLCSVTLYVWSVLFKSFGWM